MAYCERCGNIVAEEDIVPVCVARMTMSSPAEYSEWCRDCCGTWQPRTRAERLQAAADAGCDTWADYRGEK